MVFVNERSSSATQTLHKFCKIRSSNSPSNIMSEVGSLSDDSSSRVESSTNTQTESGKASESSNSFSLAGSETRIINRNKKILLLFILVAAGAVGYFTYSFVRKEEQNNFETAVSC